MKNKIFKIVETLENGKVTLCGFYDSKNAVDDDVERMRHKSPHRQYNVKLVNPDRVFMRHPTDYSHYCRSLIPDDEFKRVVRVDDDDYSSDFLFWGESIYYDLSKVIPTHYTVIDIGCGINAQSYFFTNHKLYIGVDLPQIVGGRKKSKFKPKGTELYECTAGYFVKNILPKLKLDMHTTFAICSHVPNWHNESAAAITRNKFLNTFIYNPE